MNCQKCGYVLTGEDLFCKNCGTAVSPPGVPAQPVVGGSPMPSVPVQPAVVGAPQPMVTGPVSMPAPPPPVVGESVPVQPVVIGPEMMNTPVQPMVTGPVSMPAPPPPVVEESVPTQPVVIGPEMMNVPVQPMIAGDVAMPAPSPPVVEESVPAQPVVIGPEMMNAPVQPMIAGDVSMPAPPLSNPTQPIAVQAATKPSKGIMDKIKNVNSKYIIMGVLGLLVVIIIVLVCILIGTNSKANSGSSNADLVLSNNAYKVNFGGFVFTIPGSYIYDKSDQVLMVGDEKGTWLAQFEIAEGSFEQLKKNKNKVQALLKQNGYESTSAEEKAVGGVDFITFELTISGVDKMLLGYAKINAMYFVPVTLQNIDNKIDYKLLERVAPIIKAIEAESAISHLTPRNYTSVVLPDDIIK